MVKQQKPSEYSMKNIVSMILLALVVLAGSSGCAHSDGPYKGKVVELDTGKPIEGAVVAGQWTIEPYVHSERICDTKETITDKNGEFELPKGSCWAHPFAIQSKPWVVVFKPGYLGYPPLGASQEDRKAQMPTFTGREFKDKKQYNTIRLGRPKMRTEREFTVSHAEGLFHDNDIFGKLPNLLRLVNEESRTLGIGKIGPSDNGGHK